MKKILFLLLLITSIAQGQTTLANKLKITGNVEDLTATKVAVQTNEGLINWRNVLDIRGNGTLLSTGLIKNGLISANGDPTKFNITAGIGVISNFDDPENPISTLINFPAFNSITPTYLNTGNITYVAINSTPAVVMQATPFTPEQRRSLITLGAVIHSNLTTINVLNNISAPSNASTNQLHDFMEAVGALNLTGNKYTENGANLQLNKSAGVLFKLGSNFAVDWRNPHQIAQAGGTAITFRYRTQNGTESADMTSISPSLYDLNNVLTTVPNNKFTIQTVTVFQTGLTRIQWGQTLYDDLTSAKNALLTRNFVVENNIKENGVTRAYIIVRNSTTSLQNIADAYISEAQKFGGVASGGVALTLANIVTALGYTPENVANKQNSLAVDGTGVKYTTVDATNAGLALKQNTLTNPITGTGTINFIPKFTGTTTQGNSMLSDVSGEVSLNQTNNTSGFKIKGFANPAENVNIFISSANTTSITATRTLLFSSGTASSIFQRAGASVYINDNNTNPIFLGSAGAPSLFNTTTNNGQGVAQFNGNITLLDGTLANHGVTKSQLDLKADLAGTQTFTGIHNFPTAVAGTNTGQVASTAFVLANSISLSGNQDITGIKNFLGTGQIFLTGSTGIYSNITTNSIGSVMYVETPISQTNPSVYLQSNNLTGALRLNNANTSGALIDFSTPDAKIMANGDFVANTLKLKTYTVATLPAGVIGMFSYVTDALAPTYMATVVGGGAVVTPVFYNGSNWVAH